MTNPDVFKRKFGQVSVINMEKVLRCTQTRRIFSNNIYLPYDNINNFDWKKI